MVGDKQGTNMGTIQQILEDIDSLPPEMQEQALDFVRFLKSKPPKSKLKPKENTPNGTKLAQLMEEASGKNLFSHIKDPAAWQREIRQDPPLPGRED